MELVASKKGRQNKQLGISAELEFNVFSEDNSAIVELYAYGPCVNIGRSKNTFNVTFLPCTCPLGFQSSMSRIECVCECDMKLQPDGFLRMKTGIWIGVTNDTDGELGYVVEICPSDYCTKEPVDVSLKSSHEIDRQCAHNRSGVLCGECEQGLSLILATTKCKECSNIYLLLLIPFALAGIVLVTFILAFNITIATGNVHGLIFYANVLAANKAVFLPFDNVLTVITSWVNLDLGIETYFYGGMSSQAKVLLQLVFPSSQPICFF